MHSENKAPRIVNRISNFLWHCKSTETCIEPFGNVLRPFCLWTTTYLENNPAEYVNQNECVRKTFPWHITNALTLWIRIRHTYANGFEFIFPNSWVSNRIRDIISCYYFEPIWTYWIYHHSFQIHNQIFSQELLSEERKRKKYNWKKPFNSIWFSWVQFSSVQFGFDTKVELVM